MANIKPLPAHVKEELRPRDTTRHMDYVGVKEEPHSGHGHNLDLSTSAVHIKEEPLDYEDNHPQYLTSPRKEESCDYKEGLQPNASPPPYSTLCIKEEAESGEDDLDEALEYTTVCIKEEPASGDEGDFLGRRGISGVFHDHSTLGGDEESDGLSEIEYTTVRIKGEESCEEDYVGDYATRDHTYMVTRTDDRMKAPCNTRKLHKTLNCGECGKVFFGKAAYRLHQKVHRGEAVYSCATCGKKFSRKGSCEKHQEAAHIPEKSFECPTCDRYFSSKLGLTLHQRVHTRDPAFACKDCSKSFTSHSALIQHQRVHYTDRRLLCAKCGLTFNNKSDLINHQILHPVQQSFVCSECSQKFLTKAELSAHWKVHTVIKAFAWRNIHFTHQETGSGQ